MPPARSIARLGHEIDGADFQRLERHLGAALGQRRDHDHRHRPQRHDLAQERQAVHVRHLDVERDHVGIERLDPLARDDADRRRCRRPRSRDRFEQQLVSNCRITAESSTIKNADWRASICHSSSPKSSISPHGCCSQQPACRNRFLRGRSRSRSLRAEQPAHDPAGRRVIVDAPRQRAAEILRGAAQTLRPADIAARIRRCRCRSRCCVSVTLPPPKTLISMRSRAQPALISSLISFSMAKLPKRVDLQIVAPAARTCAAAA